MTELVRDASVRLANIMDRRHFVRRMAGGTFASVAGLAAGRLISPAVAFAYVSHCESTTGSGCPRGCGPSPCCDHLSSSCGCSNGYGGCKGSDRNPCCHGTYNDWGSGVNCWTCTYDECIGHCYYRVSTTCCDCDTSCGCPQPCVAYSTSYTYISGCPACAIPGLRPGTVVGVTMDDPANSWGIQPQLTR